MGQQWPGAALLPGVVDHHVAVFLLHLEPAFAYRRVELVIEAVEMLVRAGRAVWLGQAFGRGHPQTVEQPDQVVGCPVKGSAGDERRDVPGREVLGGHGSQLPNRAFFRLAKRFAFWRGAQGGAIALGDVQRDRHSQIEKQVSQDTPLDSGVVLLLGVGEGLQLIQHLPDPGADAHGGAQERQGAIEDQPTGVLEGGPAAIGVGHRLAVGQFHQRLGVCGEQSCEDVARHGVFAQGQGAAHAPEFVRFHEDIHDGPGRG